MNEEEEIIKEKMIIDLVRKDFKEDYLKGLKESTIELLHIIACQFPSNLKRSVKE